MAASMFTTSMYVTSFSALLPFQWIKRKMNKGSRMNGGYMRISQNKETGRSNTKNINRIAKVKETMRSIADINKNRYVHIACSPSRLQKH